MCPPSGYNSGGTPRSGRVRRNLPEARRPNQTGWIRKPPSRFANVRLHLARLVRTPSWAWHPERHQAGCRYARLLRAVGL